MIQRQHSLTSRQPGFIPLDGGSSDVTMADNTTDIPLANVRSNGSTGARKPGANHADSFQSEKEKQDAHVAHWGRRRKLKEGIGRAETGEEGKARLNWMGQVYAKIINFSPVTRYLVYIVPVGILLAVPMIVLALTGHQYDIPLNHGRKDSDGKYLPGPPLFKLFEWIEITWLTLWAAKLTAWMIPQLFIFFTGIISVGTKKYATVLSNLNVPLALFLWALAVYLTFKNFFSPASNNGVSWVHSLGNVLGASFVSLAVLLGEKAIVQLIGVSYHQRSFSNRIKASKREVQLLSMLYDASRALFPPFCEEFAEEDYVISDSIELKLSSGRRSRGKTHGNATPMRIIGDVSRLGDKMTSAVGHVAQEITGKQVLNPNSAHSIVLEALEKLGPSEALGRRIWMSFVVEGKDALYLEDFQEVLGPAYREEADEAFHAIDNDMNGDVSLDELVRKVIDIGKERKAIGEGMKDIGQALRVFDKVLLFIVFLIAIFIFLAFFNSSFITTLATAGTALLSLSFIFAVTTQEFLGSCIFLFVKHPYDVGDRVQITSIDMVVERISLLYTVFTRLDTCQTSQVPNIQLNNLWIDNLSRSKAMSESISVNVSFDTSFEDVELLRKEMEAFVRAPENTRDYQPDFSIGIGGVNDLDKLTLNISINHKSNWHNNVVRATRRSKFMCALALALKKVPIYGPGGGADALGGPANPAYSVSVSNDWAANARDESAKTRDAGRLVPSMTQSAEEAAAAEAAAAAEINNRPPVVETSGLWDNRAERTLSTLEESVEDQQRSRDIETMRADLIKSASQRGRRRAGEGLPGISPTVSGHSGSMSQQNSPSMGPFQDEEAVTGMPSSFYGLTRGDTTASGSSRLRPSMSLNRPERGASVQSQSSRFRNPSQHQQ